MSQIGSGNSEKLRDLQSRLEYLKRNHRGMTLLIADLEKQILEVQNELTHSDAAIETPKSSNENLEIIQALHVRAREKAGLAKHEDAISLYKEILSINAADLDAHFFLGNSLSSLRQFDEAIQSYDSALKVEPSSAACYINRGIAMHQLGRYLDAIGSYNAALAINPEDSLAYNNRGNSQNEMGQLVEAIASYDQAARINPNYAMAFYNRGVVFDKMQDRAAAVISFASAIQIDQSLTQAYFMKANALSALGKYDQAIPAFEKALSLDASMGGAWNNLGIAFHNQQRYQDAVKSYEMAITLNAQDAIAWSNLGNTQNAMMQKEQALDSYTKAIEIQPNFIDAIVNRSIVLQSLGKYEDALSGYSKVLELSPNHVESLWNQGLSRLTLGNYEQGWLGYEQRWLRVKPSSPLRNFQQNLWLGSEPIKGKTILLHAEQGLGDSIQFARYIKAVSSLGATVVVEVQKALLNIFKDLAGIDVLIAAGDPIPQFDLHCPFMTLPLALSSHFGFSINGAKYLNADPERVDYWKQRLGITKKLRVGLVWSGNINHGHDEKRSVTLKEILSYLPSDIEYISLQKEIREGDRSVLLENPQILHFEEELRDFSDTAALCALMDVIISVDTSPAHLAGALGCPLWLALSVGPDWRWGLEGERTDWYDSARLYRQSQLGDWGDVFKRIGSDLNVLKLKSSKDNYKKSLE